VQELGAASEAFGTNVIADFGSCGPWYRQAILGHSRRTGASLIALQGPTAALQRREAPQIFYSFQKR
jgi:hypothetical protein